MATFKAIKLINGMFLQEVDVALDTYILPGITLPPTMATAVGSTTGTISVTMGTGVSVYTITPTGACTFNASGGITGARLTFIITTSGTSSFVLTWGTNFKSAGTLSTGTVSAKVFCVSFVCKDGTVWCEDGRTIAM